MPACGDCAKLFLLWIWNGFMHTFHSLSRPPPPYRNHFKWINLNPTITLTYIVCCAIPRKIVFPKNETQNLIKLFMNIEWRSEWCRGGGSWQKLHSLFQKFISWSIFDFYFVSVQTILRVKRFWWNHSSIFLSVEDYVRMMTVDHNKRSITRS